MANKNTSGRSYKGQELVEFAIGLLLLVFILFGVFDLGRAFHAAISIANAARVGARAGVNHNWSMDGIPLGESKVINAAQVEARSAGLDLARLTVIPSCGSCTSGNQLSVLVTYSFDLVTGSFFSVSPISIRRTAVMEVP